MATPDYPANLPKPMAIGIRPVPQLISTESEDGPQAVRRRSRQPGAILSTSFRFLESEYSEFISWFKSSLLHGHKWFWIELPSAGGYTWHVARFVSRPTSKLVGHRVWDVSAELEIPDRRFAPHVRAITNDPLRSFVISLLMAEGSVGATTFVDSISGAGTPAPSGSAPPTLVEDTTLFGSTAINFTGTLKQCDLLVSPVTPWIGAGALETTLFGTPWCIDFWVKAANVSLRTQSFVADDYAASGEPYNIVCVCSTTGAISTLIRGTSGLTTASGFISNNVWRHVAINGDGAGTYRLWAHGSLASTVTGVDYPKQVGTGKLLLGAQNRNYTGFERNFQGRIKAFRVTWGHSRFGAATSFTPPNTLALYEA